jgi:hypothetical protein
VCVMGVIQEGQSVQPACPHCDLGIALPLRYCRLDSLHSVGLSGSTTSMPVVHLAQLPALSSLLALQGGTWM